MQHRVWVIRNVFTDGKGSLHQKYDAAVREIRRTRRKLESPLPRQRRARLRPPLRIESNFTKARYMAAVRKAKSYIRAGDIFQVVPSQRFSAQTDADPFEIYRALRVVNPSPYLCFLKIDNVSVVGELARDARESARTQRATTARSPEPSRAAATKPKTARSKQNCSPIPKSAPNTSCWLIWAATTWVASASTAR